jgi:hypothetical protein
MPEKTQKTVPFVVLIVIAIVIAYLYIAFLFMPWLPNKAEITYENKTRFDAITAVAFYNNPNAYKDEVAYTCEIDDILFPFDSPYEYDYYIFADYKIDLKSMSDDLSTAEIELSKSILRSRASPSDIVSYRVSANMELCEENEPFLRKNAKHLTGKVELNLKDKLKYGLLLAKAYANGDKKNSIFSDHIKSKAILLKLIALGSKDADVYYINTFNKLPYSIDALMSRPYLNCNMVSMLYTKPEILGINKVDILAKKFSCVAEYNNHHTQSIL